MAGRIARDWQAKYGHPVVLLETFVERERFRGTVYRAANWQRVGVTAGRTRQDRHTCHASAGQRHLSLSVAPRLSGGAPRVKTPEEVLRELADNPAGLLEYAAQLQRQLAETQQELEQKAQQLAEAQAIIADLKRELFGAKADKLNEEQEEQLRQLLGDAQEQTQRAAPLSQEVLEEALAQERAEQRQRAKERPRRHLPPVELEKQQVILEPEDKLCPTSGQERPRIGQEVTTEYDYVPAKLIIREIVRPKYGGCEKPCCQGVAIAPLPPRLLPQSKLGLGLAVYLLLSRFDDHLAYYTLERIFRERFGVVITRQQMVDFFEVHSG